MFHFNYYAPTQVVFGKDTEEKTGELVKAQNCKKFYKVIIYRVEKESFFICN